MSDLTPAEELREAARLMRERAQAATAGPWCHAAALYEGDTYAAVLGPQGLAEKPETWLMATGKGGVSQEADADHAAGMHPGVALAVADWLDSDADAAAYLEAEGCKVGDWASLKVARAYLGTGDPR